MVVSTGLGAAGAAVGGAAGGGVGATTGAGPLGAIGSPQAPHLARPTGLATPQDGQMVVSTALDAVAGAATGGGVGAAVGAGAGTPKSCPQAPHLARPTGFATPQETQTTVSIAFGAPAEVDTGAGAGTGSAAGGAAAVTGRGLWQDTQLVLPIGLAAPQ